ncbi:MAG: PAS domain S-box protein [Solirubrobacteraceae bacterium]|jgi:protein-histidine pros-kinase
MGADAFVEALLRFASDGIAVSERQSGRFVVVSDSYCALTGYARDELIGRTSVELGLVADHEVRSEALGGADQRPSGVRELRIRRKDGEVRLFEFSMQLLPAGLMLTISRDATGPRRIESQLRDSEERFRLLAEDSTDVITRVSTQSIMHYVSPASRELYGYDPEEMVGRSAWDYIHPEDHAMARQTGAAVRVRGSHDHAIEYRARRSDGSYVWVESKVRTLWDPVTGEAAGFHNTTRDISARKRAEAEILHAKEEAEQANRAKTDFLAGTSHELRTPLNAILGFTGVLLIGLPGPLNDEQTKQLRAVRHGGRHLLSLINDLLDLTRIESGKVELHPEAFDCHALMDEVAVGLRPLAQEKGLNLEVAPVLTAIELFCDRRAVSQILINLTNNAIKFTDRGSVRLELSQRIDRERSLTRFAVIDTGPGIALEDQARLFTAFARIASADARQIEGTGLGLHISRALADAIDGSITFESATGEGSTFALEVAVATGAVARPVVGP